ncbi:hypothetical protein L1281_002502 [Neisseria sp. HSC-16F19]|nr:hypothetical protein [Neisseria sp. HSC-16F19]MCP2041884.1 hypothetical protein [Neisseria sp. HSC-16F19]
MALPKPETLRTDKDKAEPQKPAVENWIEQGKEEGQAEPKKARKGTSIKMDEDLFLAIRYYCLENNIRFNTFVEDAIKIHAEKHGVGKN